ncbi:phosphatase PAP2 family protein [Porphyromonas crevioricanis]|uniref:phosphatase PAP2 family protein n=1 Tax=Porphyromonas crevioricanis TaxID=393921 RepID=UPI0006892DC6|nr:phosphatase PAP2 family protein [Porphyromonas crevioricanis]
MEPLLSFFRACFRPINESHRALASIEIACLFYILVTSILIFCSFDQLPKAKFMLINRGEIILGMSFLYLVYRRTRSKLAWMMRIFFQLLLLSFWYPETYEFHILFGNYDHIFAEIEQFLFHSQPALYLHELLPQWWFSELIHFSYFFYFALFVGVTLFYTAVDYPNADRVAFVIIASFFIYYLVYIFLPVAGPQYYFPAIGLEQVNDGVFPSVGNYFATHPELLPGPGHKEGIFYRLVSMSQHVGERPTAAFPSSHVGITTIVMIFFYRAKGGRKLFWAFLPIYICLCIATVYIQAHYLIDVIAGVLSGIGLWLLINWIYNKIFSPRVRTRKVVNKGNIR